MVQVSAGGTDREPAARFTPACPLYVVVVLSTAAVDGSWTVAGYLLSCWHYYLYWLAYRYGAVELTVFKTDALVMKSVALGWFFVLYGREPLDLPSAGTMLVGFSLNALGARALGIDRTYYGHEVAGLAWQRVAGFPYSWLSHPMLVGNLVAFGGSLLHPRFREDWWPLAGLHLAMNAFVLGMEMWVTPLRRHVAGGRRTPAPRAYVPTLLGWLLAGARLGLLAGARVGAGVTPGAGAILGAASAGLAAALYRSYSLPEPRQVRRQPGDNERISHEHPAGIIGQSSRPAQ